MTTDITLDAAGLALIEKHRRWWDRKAMLLTRVQGAPLGDLFLPLSDGTVATHDTDLTPAMLDVERLLPPVQTPGPLELHGDRVRTADAFSRVPWVEAILGAPVHATIQGGSMRTRPVIANWDEWRGVAAHRHQGWYDLVLSMTERLVERSRGRYAVVAPLMRGPSDLAEAVLGAELMCLSMVDAPERLHAFLDEATSCFIEILHALLARIPPIAGGVVSPFGIWAPGTVVRTQCDASAFLSARHYAEWYMPYDARISRSVDHSIIHLHSCSLHTVEPLLTVEHPQAIQVTLEVGPNVPTLAQMVPIFRKVLARKPLLVEGPLTGGELGYLLSELPHDGLAVTVREEVW